MRAVLAIIRTANSIKNAAEWYIIIGAALGLPALAVVWAIVKGATLDLILLYVCFTIAYTFVVLDVASPHIERWITWWRKRRKPAQDSMARLVELLSDRTGHAAPKLVGASQYEASTTATMASALLEVPGLDIAPSAPLRVLCRVRKLTLKGHLGGRPGAMFVGLVLNGVRIDGDRGIQVGTHGDDEESGVVMWEVAPLVAYHNQTARVRWSTATIPPQENPCPGARPSGHITTVGLYGCVTNASLTVAVSDLLVYAPAIGDPAS